MSDDTPAKFMRRGGRNNVDCIIIQSDMEMYFEACSMRSLINAVTHTLS